MLSDHRLQPRLLPGSRDEPYCLALRSVMSEPRYTAKEAVRHGRNPRVTQVSNSRLHKENRMKTMKPYAVVLGSLAVLAMSLPVTAQDITQSTTTTQTPDQPITQTTDTSKSKTKYKHHHVKETKTKEKTTTTTIPPVDQTQTTTTTTTAPPQ